MRVESGAASTDRNWWLGRFIVLFLFVLWFAYDGFVGYPRQNESAARPRLAAPPLNEAKLSWEKLPDEPDEKTFDAAKRKAPVDLAALHGALGEPALRRVDNGGQMVETYVSRWGFGVVPISRDNVPLLGSAQWTSWRRTRSEIATQFRLCAAISILCLYLLYRFFRATTLHVSVDEREVVYAGQHIPMESITALRDYNPKGWIDLYYKSDGAERKVRLDDEKIRKFDEVVAAICAQKGFRNEVLAHRQRKAAQEAAEDTEDAGRADSNEPAEPGHGAS